MKVMAAVVVAVVCGGVVTVVAPQEPKTAMPQGVVLGPAVGQLGHLAQVSVPEGYLFLEAGATRRFLEEGQNIPSGHELGTVIYRRPDNTHWFAVFTYADSGHVDDSDRNDIDPDAIMTSMKTGTEEDNAQRRKRGWATLTIGGWQKKPYYEVQTNNLTWSTRVMSENELSVNHSVQAARPHRGDVGAARRRRGDARQVGRANSTRFSPASPTCPARSTRSSARATSSPATDSRR